MYGTTTIGFVFCSVEKNDVSDGSGKRGCFWTGFVLQRCLFAAPAAVPLHVRGIIAAQAGTHHHESVSVAFSRPARAHTTIIVMFACSSAERKRN